MDYQLFIHQLARLVAGLVGIPIPSLAPVEDANPPSDGGAGGAGGASSSEAADGDGAGGTRLRELVREGPLPDGSVMGSRGGSARLAQYLLCFSDLLVYCTKANASRAVTVHRVALNQVGIAAHPERPRVVVVAGPGRTLRLEAESEEARDGWVEVLTSAQAQCPDWDASEASAYIQAVLTNTGLPGDNLLDSDAAADSKAARSDGNDVEPATGMNQKANDGSDVDPAADMDRDTDGNESIVSYTLDTSVTGDTVSIAGSFADLGTGLDLDSLRSLSEAMASLPPAPPPIPRSPARHGKDPSATTKGDKPVGRVGGNKGPGEGDDLLYDRDRPWRVNARLEQAHDPHDDLFSQSPSNDGGRHVRIDPPLAAVPDARHHYETHTEASAVKTTPVKHEYLRRRTEVSVLAEHPLPVTPGRHGPNSPGSTRSVRKAPAPYRGGGGDEMQEYVIVAVRRRKRRRPLAES